MADQGTDVDRASRIAEIRDIACEVFDVGPGKVEAAASFREDLGVDSIDGIGLLSRLQERFAITFEEDDLGQLMPRLMTNLRTVYEFVAENIGW
jgi:acyl carrier protein